MRKTSGQDVHKATVFYGIFDGKNYQEFKEFSTLTSSIMVLGEYLKSEDVEDVALERTGMYWIPVWNIPEEMGFHLTLVNHYLIKQMPGRKRDVKDAQWIATLLHKELVRSSLIPCKEIRELSTYSRKYVRLQQRKTSVLQGIDDTEIEISNLSYYIEKSIELSQNTHKYWQLGDLEVRKKIQKTIFPKE